MWLEMVKDDFLANAGSLDWNFFFAFLFFVFIYLFINLVYYVKIDLVVLCMFF